MGSILKLHHLRKIGFNIILERLNNSDMIHYRRDIFVLTIEKFKEEQTDFMNSWFLMFFFLIYDDFKLILQFGVSSFLL
jgi:hypothetical protein